MAEMREKPGVRGAGIAGAPYSQAGHLWPLMGRTHDGVQPLFQLHIL